jgi:glutamate-1-semialdehyde 2,1-aminomutase
MPLAAVAGRKDVMSLFDKSVAGDQWLMQVGTLSGNPIAAVAGLKTLEILKRPGHFERLRELGDRIQEMLVNALNKRGVAHQIVGNSVLFDVIFREELITDYRDLGQADKAKQAAFNKSLRASGILKSPAKIYPHLALTEADLSVTHEAIEMAADSLI